MAWFKRGKSHSPAIGATSLPPRRPLAMALEPRVMFDGAAVATAVAFQPGPPAHAPASHAEAGPVEIAHRPAALWADDIAPLVPRHADFGAAVSGSTSRDVLFVDSRVQDAASLLAHVRPGTEVVYLQQNRDGLQQMTDYLEAHSGVASVQIIAHGNDGDLWLGDTYLSAGNIRTHALDLRQMAAGVKAGGDIQIYASDTAVGGKALTFVGSLADLTREVAASSNRIGAAHHYLNAGEDPARAADSPTRVVGDLNDAVVPPADKQVVFINSNVADLQTLVAGLPAGEQYVLLDSTRDGLLQIEQYLQAHPGVSAIHLVSHGATGEFQVGSTWINEADFSTYSAEFAQIGGAMKAGGDFLIYGCDVAGNADGRALVQQISSASGLNVAASTDATGAATLGGDWALEYDAGVVHTGVVFSAASEQGYDHVLSAFDETYDSSVGFDTGATPVASTTLDGLTYTGDQAVEYQVVSGSLPSSSSGGEMIVNTQGTQMSTLTIQRQDGSLMAIQSFDIDIFVSNQVTVEALDGSGNVVGTIVLDYSAGATAYTPGHVSNSSLFHVTLSGNTAFSQVKSLKLVETSGNGTFLSPTLDNFTYLAPSSPPTLTASSGTTSFVAGDNVTSTPVAVDSGITLADGNSTTATSATVSITGNLHNTEDVLGFVNTSAATYGNISAAYNAATGVLTLTSSGGTASIAQWQAALRAVTYTDTAVTPNAATRTISFEITSDGLTAGNTAAKQVSVTDTDQTPIVSTTGSTGSYREGAAAITIDSGISVSDLDNTTQSSGTVSVSSGFHSGDTLGFTNTDSALFGNIAASYNASTGVLTLTSSGATATDAQWANALKSVTFSSTSTTLGARTISFATSDGTKTSAAATDTINVVDPVQVTTDSGSAAFVAGDNTASTPVAIDSGLTVTDTAATTLASATAAITGGFHSGEDVLAFTNDGSTMGNITGSYNATTGVLTLTSAGATATLAQWQSALDSITYADTAVTPNTTTRTISFTAVDGGGTTSNTATRTVTVTATDQTPIVTTTGGTTNYIGGTSAVTIDGGISVSDLDNTTQFSGTISIGSGFHSGDTLTFVNTNSTTFGNIVGSYNAATGVLTLTSSGATATDAQWANALSSVTFSSTSTTYGNRTIAFATSDGAKTSVAATDTVDVLGPPQITTDSGSASFVAGDNTASTPVVIDSGLTVTDGASTTLASATAAITGGFHSGEDVLSFVNDGATMGNISASYNAATGVLTLTSSGATATLAQWQSALDSVTYTDTAITPNTTTRTVSFTAVDGGGNTSNTATRTITVTATDQTPIVTTIGGTTNYVGGTSAVTIDGGISVSDLDNTTQSSATVAVNAGFHSGDTLTFVNTNSTTFGNIVGSYNAATGVLTLTSSGATATDAQWSNALSSVTFSSTSTTYGNRTIAFATSDGTKTSVAATDTVDVLGPPQITTDTGSASFVAGDNTASTPVVIDSGLTVTDGSSTTLASATAAITGGFHSGEDVLAFTNDGSTMGNISASYNAATGVLTLTSAGATATLAQWQSALDSVTYTDTAITPNTSTRTVSFTAVDGGGTTSSTATRTVTVTATDQTPIVTTTGGTTNYVVGTSPAAIDSGISVSDLDNATQSSATVAIAAGFHSGDVLGFTNTSSALYGNIVASYNAATGVMTLTSAGATASDAQWSNALSAVTFSSSSTSYGDRTIAFATSDGTKTSAVATDTVDLLGLPKVTDVGSTTPDGSYKVGDTIYLTVTFDQVVMVDTAGGSPALLMETGSVDHDAVYVSGSGSDTLTFAYTVQAGDSSSDLDYASTSALALDGGTIRSTAGVDAVLTLPATGGSGSIAGQHDIVVDGIAPTVVSVGAPPNGTYVAGQSLDFTVNYSEAVTVDTSGGTPRIAITLDTGGTVYADYVSGSGTTALVFRYTVATGQADPDGVALAGAIEVNGGGIRDGAGNAEVDTLDGVASTSGVLVDAVAPTADIVVADTALKAGETSQVTITFSEAVSGLTTADLTVANGTLSDLATSDGGITWTATLTPTADVTDASNQIVLDNTGVQDAAGNTGAGATISNSYAIDTRAPVVSAVVPPADGIYLTGQQMDFTVRFSEAVFVDTNGGTPRIAIELDTGGTVYADYVSGSGTDALVFRLTVQPDQRDTDGIVLDGAIDAHGGLIADAAGNAAELTLEGAGDTTGLLVNAIASPVVLPAEPPMDWVDAGNHGSSTTDSMPLPPLHTLQPQDLPTIFFEQAAPALRIGTPIGRDTPVLAESIGLRQTGHAWLEPEGSPPIFWAAVEPGRIFHFNLPVPAEVLRITRADGLPPPAWLSLDPVTGALSGVAPRDFSDTALQLTVRDAHGQVRDVPLELSSFRTGADRPDHAPSHPPASDRGAGKPVEAKAPLHLQFGRQRNPGIADHAALLRQLAVARQHAAAEEARP